MEALDNADALLQFAHAQAVDHDARRRLIAEALWRVASRHGLDAVSLRHVAAEAGVSMGLVQHYFTTKEDMLRFALETIGERVTQRIGHRVAALSDLSDPHGRVRTVLLDPADRSDGR